MPPALVGRLVSFVFLALNGDGDTTPKLTFQIDQDGSEFRWRLMEPEGRVLALSGRGFATKAAVIEDMVALRERCSKRYQDPKEGLLITELYAASPTTFKWRWVLHRDGATAAQNLLLAVSGGEFGTLKEAEEALAFSTGVRRARIIDPK